MKRACTSSTCTEAHPLAELSPEVPPLSPPVPLKRANLLSTLVPTASTLNPMIECENRLPLVDSGRSAAADLSSVNPSIGISQAPGSSSVNVSLASNASRSPSTRESTRKGRKKKDEDVVLNWRAFTEDKKLTVNSAISQRSIEDGHLLNQDVKESGRSEEDVWKNIGVECANGGNGGDATVPCRENNNGDIPIKKEGSSPKYGRPPTSIFSNGYKIPKVEIKTDETPSFGTKSNPIEGLVEDDVDVQLRKLGLPTSFGTKGRKTTDKQNDSRAKSSSSERGAIGMNNACVPMTLPKPNVLNWRTVDKSAQEEGENEEKADMSKLEVSCCVEESASRWTRTRLDKVIPDHKEDYIDSHCHLDYIWEKNHFHNMATLRKWYSEAFPRTFRGCIPNFIKPENWKNTDWIDNIVKDDQVLGTSWGIHPHFSGSIADVHLQTLKKYVLERKEELKIIAIGECGIDLSGKNDVPLERQLEVFKAQVQLAYEADLPIIIHCREGKGPLKDPEDEVLNVLKERPNHPIHRHCFTRDASVAIKWMRTLHDVSFGFTPAVLFPDNSYRFKQVLTVVPINRVHLETDAPYFKANDYSIFRRDAPCSLPGAAITVAVGISEMTGLTLDEVIRHTRGCTERIYRIGRMRGELPPVETAPSI